jgi:aminopeptidase N
MKGPLVLWALEHRIGRPAVAAALRAFVAARAGQPATWDDLIAAVTATAGPDTAHWLAAALGAAGLPAEVAP